MDDFGYGQIGDNSRVTCKASVFKSRLCVFHAAGRCSHGSDCSFAHSVYELADPKTVLCPKMEQFGFCDEHSSNASCLFAHDQIELKHLPKVVKTALCRYYPQGKCRANNACRLAHSIDELDPAVIPMLFLNPDDTLTRLYLSASPSPSASPSASSTEPSLANSPSEQQAPAEVDLRALQASLLSLALELEKLRHATGDPENYQSNNQTDQTNQ